MSQHSDGVHVDHQDSPTVLLGDSWTLDAHEYVGLSPTQESRRQYACRFAENVASRLGLRDVFAAKD